MPAIYHFWEDSYNTINSPEPALVKCISAVESEKKPAQPITPLQSTQLLQAKRCRLVKTRGNL